MSLSSASLLQLPQEMTVCSKILTKTDIQNRFSMKTINLQSFPPFEDGENYVSLNIEDEGGKEWLFRLIIRKKGKYKKPVLSGGWRQFVKTKNLKMGDQAIFFKVEDRNGEGVKYKIRVMKQVKIFKAVIGYALYRPIA